MALTKIVRASTLLGAGWTAFNNLIDDLLSTSNGKGASQIGVEDSAGNITADNVEDAIAEIYSDTSSTRVLAETFDENTATTTGLTWGYKGGLFRLDSTVTTVAAGTIGLTDDATNYIEIDPSDGNVKKNTSSFTSGRIPIRTVVTSSGVQTTTTDKRAWFSQVAGATATAAGIIELATDAETNTGTATDRAVTPANLASMILDEDDMSSDSASKTSSQQAIKAYTDNETKKAVIYATRAQDAASGNVDYTGFGFQPTLVEVHFGINDSEYFGISVTDGTTTRHIADARSGVAGTYQTGTEIIKVTDGTNSQVATYDSFLSDGIRMAYTKSGTPVFGTISITLIGYR